VRATVTAPNAPNLDPGITGHGLALPKEEEGGASRANDVVKVQGCGWV
jgi:hypothetical protein